jgi:hypothetical protein
MKKITLLLFLMIFSLGNSQTLQGTWKMSPVAGALAVGPTQGDGSWWSNSGTDVTTRACYFDDDYIFNSDGSFNNVMGSQSWIEGWQGGTDSCGTPVAPHNGSNAATWSYNSTANTLTLTGVGAYIGLAKVYNGGELTNPSGAPASITYTVSSFTTTSIILDISIGGGWWRYKLTKQTVASPLEGTWRMSPQAGAFGVGPTQGDTQWFSNSLADVTTRACFFDDDYVFNADGTFNNVLGSQSWIEGWQGGSDSCGIPVAPHNGSNPATYSYNTTANTITLTGVGAYLGLAKAYNGGELANPANAPAAITYTVTSITANLLTLDISIGGGWWRFILAKQGVAPTCNDGIQNGTETGVDCGGTCSNPCLAQINLPINFEGNAIDYTVTDFGDCVSTKIIDPTDAGNTVIRTVKPTTAPLWGGTTIGNPGFSSSIPFTSINRKMYVRVWSPDAGIPVRLKVEVVGNPTQSCETQTNTTVANGWQTMEFDFNNQASGTAAFNSAFVFNMASIFFNFGTDGATAGSKTYYFDDVSYGTPLGIDSYDSNGFKMYPNPAKDFLILSSTSIIDNIQIYNTLGQLVSKQSSTSNEVSLNVSNLSKGIYVVVAQVGTSQIREQFIKE